LNRRARPQRRSVPDGAQTSDEEEQRAMKTTRERDQERARRNRVELIDAGLTRRDLGRMGLLGAGGLLIPKSGLSARAVSSAGDVAGTASSPDTMPFVAPFRRLDVAEPCLEPEMGAPPTEEPNTIGGEARARRHQRFSEFATHGTYYAMHEQQGYQVFHPELPPQRIWGFGELRRDGTVRPPAFPGPVYHERYGQPACVRMFNDLPPLGEHVGFGRPETSTHLHNGHTPSESDGNPLDYFGPGRWYDYHYANILAGHDTWSEDPATGLRGDAREALSTLWYHDHRYDFTAQNTYRGLVGMYLLFGPQDSGDETDSAPGAFRLPSGQFDIPMVLSDKSFDSDGNMYFDMFNTDGILGDKFCVNGVIQPVLQVHPRKYRFRLLNGGPSRFYSLFLTDIKSPKTTHRFLQITNDGNLLPAPVEVSSVTMAVAERMDVVIDFSKYAGKTLYLENRLEMKDGRRADDDLHRPGRGDMILKIEVVLPRVEDPSQVPARFFDVPALDTSEVAARRTFRFDRTKGAWAINGRFFDPNRIDARVKRNSTEIWTIQNMSGGWEHPIHVHHEELQILTRNGRTPPLHERGRKDTIRLGFYEEVTFLIRFREWTGRYPLHCHNTLHEDHSMMTLWEIED
jgi:FtsP/CotA-like multicopper oxidase with cupredoxin domain